MASSHKLDIGGLLSGKRQRLALDQPVDLEPFESVRFPEPAHVHLEMHSAGEILEIAGSIDAVFDGECDRCLAGVSRALHVDVDERLEAGPDAQRDPFGASNVLTGDRLDVKDLATQLVCSAVPLHLLCEEKCKGLCYMCGEDKNTRVCACLTERDNGKS